MRKVTTILAIGLTIWTSVAVSAENAEVDLSGSENVSLCSILSKNIAFQREWDGKLISVTAMAYYDFEHGFFLRDVDCAEQSVGNLAVIEINLPEGKSEMDFPDLKKLWSQDFMKNSLGRRIYCTCVGKMSYSNGYPRFTLSSVKKVWTAD